MAVQEFAVHILLAGSIRIGRMTLRLERNVIPLHQEPVMGRDIRFERMIAVPVLSYLKLLYAFYQNALINTAVFPLN